MIRYARLPALFVPAAFLLLLTACERETQKTQPQTEPPAATQAQPKPAEPAAPAAPAGEMKATAHLQPTQGNNAAGVLTFTKTQEGVEIAAELTGLSPGQHGIHVHENGDCSAPDASSAGGHFNPENTSHGAPDNPPAQRHVGDLGNIEAAADGTANYRRVDQIITLDGPNSVVGKAVVVHSGPDDLTSQPAGDSGARVACGVIELTPRQ